MPRNQASSSRRVRQNTNPNPIEENQFQGPGGLTTPKELLVDDAFLDVNALRGTLVYDLLEAQGWIEFVGKRLHSVKSLVLWFYRWFKIDIESDSNYAFKVKFEDESSVSFDENDFNTFLGIGDPCFYPDGSNRNPVKEVRNWPVALEEAGFNNLEEVTLFLNNAPHWPNRVTSSYPNVVFFTGDDKMLLKIVREVIFPTKNTDNRVPRFYAIVLMLLKLRVPMHLPHLLMLHMSEAPTNSLSHYLPYGGLVTLIMRRWRIALEGDDTPTAPLLIGVATMVKQQSIRVGSRIFQHWETVLMTEEEREAYGPLYQAREMKKARNRRARGQRAPAAQAQDEPPADDDDRGDMFEMPRDEGGSSAPPPEQSVRAELDSIRARQKRHGRKLSGIVQFLKLLGQKTGTSTDALDDLPSSPEE